MQQFLQGLFVIIILGSAGYCSDSNPSTFAHKTPLPGGQFTNYTAALATFLDTAGGREFLLEKGLTPNQVKALKATDNEYKTLFEDYKRWYHSKYAIAAVGAASAAEQARRAVINAAASKGMEMLKKAAEDRAAQKEQLRQDAERARLEEEQKRIVEETAHSATRTTLAEKETALAEKETALVTALTTAKNQQEQHDALLAIAAAHEGFNEEFLKLLSTSGIRIKEKIFIEDDSKNEYRIGFYYVLKGKKEHFETPNLTKEVYEKTKKAFIIWSTLFSPTYDAASAAMGDLVTEILASAFPQPSHLNQIEYLAKTGTSLTGYLNAHTARASSLSMPFSDLLKIKFSTNVEELRVQARTEFDALAAEVAELVRQSRALEKFLAKIEESIALPITPEFTKEDIKTIFSELGLLLDIQSGSVVIEGEYYQKLAELSAVVQSLKESVTAKQTYENCKEVFEKIEPQIQQSAVSTLNDTDFECVKNSGVQMVEVKI